MSTKPVMWCLSSIPPARKGANRYICSAPRYPVELTVETQRMGREEEA